MRDHVDVQDRAMRVMQGRSHLHVLSMYGEVCQRRAPDLTVGAADDTGRTHRGDRDRETKEAARAHGGREEPDACGGRGEIERIGRIQNRTPLHKWRPASQSDRKGADRRHNQRIGKGRREAIRGTLRPRRTSVSGRSTETGSMPTLAHTSTAESATTWRGKRGGVTSRSCH